MNAPSTNCGVIDIWPGRDLKHSNQRIKHMLAVIEIDLPKSVPDPDAAVS